MDYLEDLIGPEENRRLIRSLGWDGVKETLEKIDPSLRRQVLQGLPSVSHLIGNKDQLAEACTVINFAEVPLVNDPSFRIEAFEINFNSFYAVERRPRWGWTGIRPPLKDLRKRYQKTLNKLGELGIAFPERFNTATAEEIIRNRTTIDRPDPRPVALVLFPKKDWNGAFAYNCILDFVQRGYRVLYFEIGSSQDVVRVRDELQRMVANASLLIFGAHSNITGSAFGDEDPAFSGEKGDDHSFNIGDTKNGLAAEIARLSEYLSDDCVVSIEGCGAGGGGREIPNVANTLAEMFRGKFSLMLSPKVPTSVLKYIFDRDNKIIKAIYSSPGEIEYWVISLSSG